MTQDRIKQMLAPKPKPIKKGGPLELSTTTPDETEKGDIAQMRERTIAQSHNRVNRGYKLREDLIKQCRRLALEQDRKLYEVMEDALAEYLERHAQSH